MKKYEEAVAKFNEVVDAITVTSKFFNASLCGRMVSYEIAGGLINAC